MDLHEELVARRRQKPFEPFRIISKDGTAVEVTRQLMFGFNGRLVLVARDSGGSWEARYSDVAFIEPLTPVG